MKANEIREKLYIIIALISLTCAMIIFAETLMEHKISPIIGGLTFISVFYLIISLINVNILPNPIHNLNVNNKEHEDGSIFKEYKNKHHIYDEDNDANVKIVLNFIQEQLNNPNSKMRTELIDKGCAEYPLKNVPNLSKNIVFEDKQQVDYLIDFIEKRKYKYLSKNKFYQQNNLLFYICKPVSNKPAQLVLHFTN